MSAGWDGRDLLQPIAADRPCGDNLEDTALLSSIDGARLFGRARPLDAPSDTHDIWKPPDWNDFRGVVEDALGRSKDLRVLATLGVSLLRTDGIAAFLQTLPVAAAWLEIYWTETFPRIDEDGDAMLRRNALNCLADGMAVIDPLRRLPLVSTRQHGDVSLRDVDIATGQMPPREGETRIDEARINAAFAAVPVESLSELHGRVTAGLDALRRAEAAMSTQAGPDGTPTVEPLVAVLTRMERVLRTQLALRAPSAAADPARGDGAADASMPSARSGHAVIGPIGSRQDALRALDAVAEYFRQHEPSSPVPIFIERAKRLVAKSFLEVLADVVPDALPHARMVGGIADQEP